MGIKALIWAILIMWNGHIHCTLAQTLQSERQGPPPNETEGVICLANCLETLSVALDAQLEGMQQSTGTINPVLYNSTKFESFCKTYELGRRCLAACEDSSFKLTVQNGFISLDYLCVQHPNEFLRYIPCFKKTHAQIDEICIPRCGDSSTVEVLQKQMEVAKTQQQFENMKAVMAQICSYLHCHTSCQSPLMQYLCQTSEPARLMRDFAQVSMQASKSALRRSDGEYLFPQECEVVAQGQFAQFGVEELLGRQPQPIGVIASEELEPVIPIGAQGPNQGILSNEVLPNSNPTRVIPQRPKDFNRGYAKNDINPPSSQYHNYDSNNRNSVSNHAISLGTVILLLFIHIVRSL